MESSLKKIIRAWRLVPEDSDYDPFSGKGAEKAGGRWNKKGVAMIYASNNISLAMLEILVNLRGIRDNFNYLAYWIDVPEIACTELQLTKDAKELYDRSITREIGSAWIQSQQSVALKVPSVVNRHEFNFLINPAHPEFEKNLRVATKAEAKRVILDPRLVECVNNG